MFELEKRLNELNIFALRDFARHTGVKSPTSKKKEQLIKEIIEITSGEKQPNVNKSKQGRPPKVFDYNFSNMFNSQNGLDLAKKTLNQEVQEIECDEIVTVAGWLELVNGNAAMLWVQKKFETEKYFVPSEVLKKYSVKMGDRVVAQINTDETRKIVKEIFSVNDCPVLRMPENRRDYFEVEHSLPKRKLKFCSEKFSNLNLMIGENTYLYGVQNNLNTTTVVDMLNDCEIENKIYLNVSIAEKNKIYLSKLNNVETFFANITDETEFAKTIVCLAVERVKRILENGEDVLFVVDDIASISGIEKVGLDLVKNLVSVTKEGDRQGSITLLAVVPNVQFNQIEKLADKRIVIENDILKVQ